jgi:dTDP-glucose 4,6-dehydratase
MEKTILVTGGSGFIGSNFILQWMQQEGTPVVNLDKLTYAGNPRNLLQVSSDSRYSLPRETSATANSCANCSNATSRGLSCTSPPRVMWIVPFMGRTISSEPMFSERSACWRKRGRIAKAERAGTQTHSAFFMYRPTKCTDRWARTTRPFSETTPYSPNSPYSASKAGSDHLVRAYHHTYGLPTLTTNCSNNYGPYQFPEKLIPLVLLNARAGKPLPVYGDGQNVRDWVFVADHCEAVRTVLAKGRVGETYNIGGGSEKRNIEVVETICAILDQSCPGDPTVPHRKLITFVKDRPGHDRRYAIDARKIERDLGWKPRESFETGMRKTVEWYLQNEEWVKEVASGAYRKWIATQYS